MVDEIGDFSDDDAAGATPASLGFSIAGASQQGISFSPPISSQSCCRCLLGVFQGITNKVAAEILQLVQTRAGILARVSQYQSHRGVHS